MIPSGCVSFEKLRKAPVLEICDLMRHQLRAKHSLGGKARQLKGVLRSFILAETRGSKDIMSLGKLMYTRFDKLLAELMDPVNQPLDPKPQDIEECIGNARVLVKMWQKRLHGDWFALDDLRMQCLLEKGRMRDLTYCPSSTDPMERWTAKTSCCDPCLNGDFEPGL